MQVSSNQQYHQNFTAKLLSQWNCTNVKGSLKKVSIIELEKRDLEFIKKFREKLDRYEYLAQIQQAIIDAATNTALAILQAHGNVFEKTKIFMASQEGKPCGFLIANIPKKMPVTQGETYSTRHNSARNETEIDWLVTWNTNRKEKLKGIGKAIIGEYFRTVKKDKFRDVFVRSEVPEFSYATYFYESLGFERLGLRRTKLVNKNDGPYVVNNFSEPNDDVIPMIITRGKINEKSKELAINMGRREFVKDSVDINELVEC